MQLTSVMVTIVEALQKCDGMYCGGLVFISEKFNSTDYQPILSLTCQIQKEDSIDNLLTVFKVFLLGCCRNLGSLKTQQKSGTIPLSSYFDVIYTNFPTPVDSTADFNG